MAHSKIALYALIVKQFRVYNYILDEDKQDDPDVCGNKGENKKLFERYVLLLLYRQNWFGITWQARVYDYIRDEDKRNERHVVVSLFTDRTDQEHCSSPVSTTTFKMKTSKQRQGKEQEADWETCFRFWYRWVILDCLCMSEAILSIRYRHCTSCAANHHVYYRLKLYCIL